MGRGNKTTSSSRAFAWGVREMNVGDPDGHRLRFSAGTDQPGDGVPLRED